MRYRAEVFDKQGNPVLNKEGRGIQGLSNNINDVNAWVSFVHSRDVPVGGFVRVFEIIEKPIKDVFADGAQIIRGSE